MKSRFVISIRSLISLAIVLGLLSACAPAATPAPVASSAPAEVAPTEAAPPAAAPQGNASDPNTLIVLTPADTQTLDPAVNYDFSGGFFLINCYEGLVKAEGSTEAKIVPALAESWEISPDGLTYTFKIRDGVKFHDGTPVNAEAVKFSFERLLSVGMGAVGNFTSIDKIEVADEMTVKFILKDPFSSFLLALTSMWGPVVVSPTAVKANEKEGDQGQAWLAENERWFRPVQG